MATAQKSTKKLDTQTITQEFKKETIKGYIKSTDVEEMIGIASDDSEDRDGEVISVDGWDLKDFKKNPVLLWAHNRQIGHDGLPIGKVTDIKIKEVDGKRVLWFKFQVTDITPIGATVKEMIKAGILNTFSVGFIPLEREGNIFTKQKLLEISVVPVPANANAVVLQRAYDAGISQKDILKVMDVKSNIKHVKMELAAESTAWNAQAAVARLKKYAGEDKTDFTKYKEGFTWLDSNNPDKFSSYKLPHHDLKDGEMVTVWRGVASAMASLMGARGGVAMSLAEKKKAYLHLSKHFAEFGKEVPDFKLIENEVLKEMFDVIEEDVNQKHNRDLKKAIREIREEIKTNKKDRSPVVVKTVAEDDPNDFITAVETLNKAIDYALKKTGKK